MIQVQSIDGLLLREMVLAGAALLEKNREAVDALNVFPVPDGDTGTNMSLTMSSATREINSKEFASAGEAAEALAGRSMSAAEGRLKSRLDTLSDGDRRAVEDAVATHPDPPHQADRPRHSRSLPARFRLYCARPHPARADHD